jgi:lysophospholipase L1-like esterase
MMRRSRRSRLRAGLTIVLVLGLGIPAHARVFRMRRLVAVGDSLLAGFGSGGLVARGATGQRNAAAASIARQARVRFSQPLMSQPGVPAPLHIDDRNGNGILDAGDVRRTSDSVGFRKSTSTSVRNLAVPGEDLQSVFETLDAEDVGIGLAQGDISGRDILKFLILGIPVRRSAVSQLTRARALHPTFILVWLGNNDVLPMATHTDPGAATMTAPEFGMRYREFLDRLAATNADMAVANLPDVTQVPALRRAANAVTSCRRPDNSTVPVVPDALLSIGLDPAQLPVPPCGRVLDPDERAQARATVVQFNAEIAAAVSAVEQTHGIQIALVDAFGLFDRIAAEGYVVPGASSADGSFVLDDGYLGGLFSLDGVHPSRTGQAVIANAFIDAIDTRFGEGIPHVDVRAVAAADPFVDNAFRPGGEPPFGLIHDSSIDIQDALNDGLNHLGDKAGDLLNDFKHRLRDLFDRIRHLF